MIYWPSVECGHAPSPAEDMISFILEVFGVNIKMMSVKWLRTCRVSHWSQVNTQEHGKGCENHFDKDILAFYDNMLIFPTPTCRGNIFFLPSNYLINLLARLAPILANHWNRCRLLGKRTHSSEDISNSSFILSAHIPRRRVGEGQGQSCCWFMLHGHIIYAVT